MPITYDNSKFYWGGNRDDSATFTVAANSIVFAFVNLPGGGAVFSAMDLGGVALGSIAGANTANVFAWCCTSPPTGVTTFNLHLTGLFQHSVALVSYNGHVTTSGSIFGTPHPQSSGTASNFNISVSSTSNDLVVSCIRVTGGTNASFFNNGTTRGSITDSGVARLILADIGGAASITLSATVQTAATSWDSVSIPLHINLTVAGGYFLALMGVGL